MQKIVSFIKLASSIGAYSPTKSVNVLSSAGHGFQNVNRELLAPFSPLVNQVCGFKVKRLVKKRCASCYFVVRDGRMHVICPKHPRHKQMAMRPKPHNTWILTHASQSKVRPW